VVHPRPPHTSDAIEAAREVFNDKPELPASSRKPAPLLASAERNRNTAKAREHVFELAEVLSKQKTGSLPFRLAGAAHPANRSRQPIHMHYARAGLRNPHTPKNKRSARHAVTDFDHAAARRDGWVLVTSACFRRPKGSSMAVIDTTSLSAAV